jgi:hypothetical protein
MKRILVLALSLFALSAGHLCGQTDSDIYLIGTTWNQSVSRNMSNETYNNTPVGFEKITSNINYMSFELWSRKENSALILEHPYDNNLRIVDIPLSQLDNLHAIDLDRFIMTKTKEQLMEWGEVNKSKTVWMIDRNDFYKSSPSFLENDRMKLIEVIVIYAGKGVPIRITEE